MNESSSRDGDIIDSEVSDTHMLNSSRDDVGISLNLHQHCLGVGELGPVLHTGLSVLTNHSVQLLLNLPLNIWIPGVMSKINSLMNNIYRQLHYLTM